MMIRNAVICIVLACVIINESHASTGKIRLDVSKGTVRIVRSSIRPDYNLPWNMKEPEISQGSGAIIKGGMILTNAHVVSDATYIQVRKENDPESYQAKIVFIAHDCDLALLKVPDPRFKKSIVELDFGGIPPLQSKVTTFGYPLGGDRISITEGVTSRIDIGQYSHSGACYFLMIQTDAAINPGNSGGPVIQNDRIVGVAFQAYGSSDNIGYMIPVPVIRHFLEDVKDGRYDGFPSPGFYATQLENPSYRRYLGMKNNQSGIIVTHLVPDGGAEGHVERGDVIMEMDGVPIANDGTIAFLNGRLSYTHLVDMKQIGEPMTLKILRRGSVRAVTYRMKEHPFRISWMNEYEKLPRYQIFGGLLFQPLSKEYLMTWEQWWLNADRRLLYYYLYHAQDNLYPERKEFVVLTRVLPDDSNTYLSGIHDQVVSSINGMPIRELKDVAEAFKQPKGGFHVIHVDGTTYPLVLKASEMDEANKRVKSKYDIPTLSRLE